MAGKFITIDASATESFDYASYLAEYFAPTGTAAGSATWLDAKLDGGFYYPADEYTVKFNGVTNDRQILVEGNDMGYDVSGFHTYYGDVDKIHFGTYDSDTMYAQNSDQRSNLIGLNEGLIVSGLGLSVPKATNVDQAEDLASNAFYDLYNYLRHTAGANGQVDVSQIYIEKLYEMFASKAQYFIGSDGDDTYVGTKFADKIDGGAGFDTLSGGKGKDLFIFNTGDSSADIETADIILDFNVKKDRIDLRGIDANENKAGDQAFKFLGKEDFTGKAGQAIWERSHGDTLIHLDTDGDAAADMTIILDGKFKLAMDHFLL